MHRGKSPKYGEHKILPIIAQKCNQWDKIYTDRCLFSSKNYIEKYKEEQFVQEGDIIINSTGGGTVGRTGYIDSYVFTDFDKFVVDSHLTLVRSIYPIASKYIYYFLISPLIQIGLEDRCSGSTNQIELGTTTIVNYLVPIPPINEQHRIIEQIQKILPLIEKYSVNQIAQDKLNTEINDKLKKSILQEAIQGRLVPQIVKEGTAQELLEQIRTEKKRLVKEGKLKKKDVVDSVIFRGDDIKYFEKKGKDVVCIDEEIPFEIPSTWEWTRLSYIADIYTGNSISETEKKAKYTGVSGRYYIGTKDVGFDSEVQYNNGVAIPSKYENDFRIAPNKSVLMCIEGGSAGRKIAILNQDVCFGNKLCCFAPFIPIEKYLFYYLQSLAFLEMFNGNKTGIIGGVSIAKIKTILVPLPPQQELKRIVMKIDEFVASIMSR